MPYIATRSFKVKGFDGTYRNVKDGDPVPEAKDWKDRKAYVERRWICREEDYGKDPNGRYAKPEELPVRSPGKKPRKSKKSKKPKAPRSPEPSPEPESPVLATESPAEPLPETPTDTESPEPEAAPEPARETEKPGNR